MTRSRVGITALSAAIVALIAVVVVAAIRPSVSTAGTARLPTAPAIHPGVDQLLNPIPSQPNPVWHADAHALFGPQSNPQYLMSIAATDTLVVVEAKADNPNLSGPIIAVDPQTGKPLWSGPSSFPASDCAVSRDGRIGCIQYTDDREEHAVLGILDQANGKVLFTTPVASPGYADIQRAADGFLFPTTAYNDAVSSSTMTLNWISSDGSRTWTHVASPGLDNPVLSEAGNVVAVSHYDDGAQVVSLESGQLLYDGADDLRKVKESAESTSASIGVMVNAGGFAVGISEAVHDQAKVRLFDPAGIERRVLDGWTLPFTTQPTEGDVLPMLKEADSTSASAKTIGAYSVSQAKFRWQVAGPDDSLADIELVGSKYVAFGNDALGGGDGVTWTFLDAASGSPRGQVLVSRYMTYSGFDGTRVVFAGDMFSGTPGPGAITAYDPQHGGTPVWKYKVSQSADDVNVRYSGPWLFRYDARVGPGVAAISRMG